MFQKTTETHYTSEVWIDKHIAARIIGLSVHTLKKLRSENAREADRLIEGIPVYESNAAGSTIQLPQSSIHLDCRQYQK